MDRPDRTRHRLTLMPDCCFYGIASAPETRTDAIC